MALVLFPALNFSVQGRGAYFKQACRSHNITIAMCNRLFNGLLLKLRQRQHVLHGCLLGARVAKC